MMTPAQCRAARAWLNWSQDDLAEKARVSQSTVRDFERERRKPIANNLDALRRVFEENGLVLTTDPAGVAAKSGVGASA